MFCSKSAKKLLNPKHRFVRHINFARSKMPRIPLNEKFPFPEGPKDANQAQLDLLVEPTVVKLPNGLNIASKPWTPPLAQISLVVKGGSPLENADFFGRADFLSKTAYTSTEKTSTFAINQQMERFGINVRTENTRDATVYSATLLTKFVPTILAIWADCLFNQSFHAYELNNTRFEYSNNIKEIPSDHLMEENIHRAAYGQNGLGLPKFANAEMIDKMDRESLSEFRDRLMRPDRFAICALGVNPKEFKLAVEDTFGNLKLKAGGEKEAISAFKGTEMRRHDKDRHKDTFITFGFETNGVSSKDIYPLFVLATLMGGGNDFSSGGPGKGMHSRLYQNVLCTSSGANSCNADLQLHKDNGLFIVSGTCGYDSAESLCNAMTREISVFSSGNNWLRDEEFQRARKLALTAFLINLESSEVVAEDFGRQLLSFRKIFPAKEVEERLAGVAKADVLRVAKSLMAKKPAVVIEGNAMETPSYAEICRDLGVKEK